MTEHRVTFQTTRTWHGVVKIPDDVAPDQVDALVRAQPIETVITAAADLRIDGERCEIVDVVPEPVLAHVA